MRSEPSEQEEEADGISFSFFLPSTNLFESLLAHRSVLWSWTEARFYEGLQSLGRNTSIHFWRYVEVTFFSPFPESLQLLQTHGFLQLRPKVCCLSEAASPPPGGNRADFHLQRSAYGSLTVLISCSLTPDFSMYTVRAKSKVSLWVISCLTLSTTSVS